MGKKLFSFVCLLAILVLAAPSPALSSAPTGEQVKSVQDLGMFQFSKFDAHYRVPSEAGVELILSKEGALPLDGAQMQAQIQDFYNEFNARNPDTVDPQKLQKLLAKEQGNEAQKSAYFVEPSIMSLAVPVEFAGSDTVTQQVGSPDDCVETVYDTTGPLHNEIPAPGPRDNNTIWYEDATPAIYNEIFFGQGPTAGVVVDHPNLGQVDLRGNTMVNYYLEQSGGKFRPYGEVYPQWLQVNHSEAYYGVDSCYGSHNVRAGELVTTVLDMINTNDPSFDWQSYDGDGDGIVDNFTIIHAGMGQEAGGGAQGDLAIWSHASSVNPPDGVLVCTAGNVGCPDRDIYVEHYSMDPENLDLGVIAEEFGHAAFGLPDIYSSDGYQNPVSNWAIMESGSWNGILGGAQPAPFPLWFRYLLGWAQPVEMNYDTPEVDVVVGQHSDSPFGTADGLKVNLPDKEVVYDNPLGTGQALWSTTADEAQFTAAFSVDLTGATSPVLSFQTYYAIERDWDYGYVEVSTDGGATWTTLTDNGGVCTTTDPNGNNTGCGITGSGDGELTYDLSAYTSAVMLRMRYSTDAAVQELGWWIDDVVVTDGATTLFSDDFEGGAGAWTTTGWMLVPYAQSYTQYYLVEWRNDSGFDQGLKYAYQTVYSDEDEWQVDRAPYTVPGMLVWFRDTSYGFDYSISDKVGDPPSYGVKSALTVIDSHPFPYTWNKYSNNMQIVRVSGRVTPGDATFTLGNTTPFKIRLGYDPFTGEYLKKPTATQKFGPEPGVQTFHDSLGYYPGFFYNGDGYLYYWDLDGGSTVPAMGNYSTRITDLKKRPIYGLYGVDLGDTILGSGNPGDDDVQYGLHIAPVEQAADGSWADIKVWNSTEGMLDAQVLASPTAQRINGIITYKVQITNPTVFDTTYTVTGEVPAGTTFRSGPGYNKSAQTVTRSGKIKAGQTLTIVVLRARVKPDQSGGGISATFYVKDEATNETVVTVNTPVLSSHR